MVIAAVVSMALVLTACGSTPSAAPPNTRAKSTTTTSISNTTATLDPTSAAVLAAYRASWGAFEQALATANAADSALMATMVDPQLQSVKGNLVADKNEGIVGRGATTLHPRITSLTATTATVADCVYSTAELVYATTGKPVPPVTPPENDGVTTILVLSGSTWKVSKQTVTDGKCAPEP